MYASLSSLVGSWVTFTPEHGDTHEGVIRTATWNTAGEPVIVIHADETPAHLGSDYVVIGHDAAAVISTLNRDAA
ncbi:MAG: hypothetical protein L0H93_02460 [Nocardioides sp.]|nr:hypothetical protein [Nocardioides sp.]